MSRCIRRFTRPALSILLVLIAPFAVTAQTLCATGILVLYAVTFACRAYYHFAFFGLIPTFLLMTLITAVAFLLAVRLNAIVVAVLGLLAYWAFYYIAWLRPGERLLVRTVALAIVRR